MDNFNGYLSSALEVFLLVEVCLLMEFFLLIDFFPFWSIFLLMEVFFYYRSCFFLVDFCLAYGSGMVQSFLHLTLPSWWGISVDIWMSSFGRSTKNQCDEMESSDNCFAIVKEIFSIFKTSCTADSKYAQIWKLQWFFGQLWVVLEMDDNGSGSRLLTWNKQRFVFCDKFSGIVELPN